MEIEYKVAFYDFLLSLAFWFFTGYREIDLTSYIQQVNIFQSGTYDYNEIVGINGGAKYPAGFLYLYSIIVYFLNPKIVEQSMPPFYEVKNIERFVVLHSVIQSI